MVEWLYSYVVEHSSVCIHVCVCLILVFSMTGVKIACSSKCYK